MPSGHLARRRPLVAVVAVGATSLTTRWDGFPPLAGFERLVSEQIRTHAVASSTRAIGYYLDAAGFPVDAAAGF
ncbi:MAG: hypothetical protein GVY33_12275 [Alphaproteobacteria bacterium]|jgi:hypothetical protein|nr:hypothetical protein [Alphaproteobacteria bacterium]